MKMWMQEDLFGGGRGAARKRDLSEVAFTPENTEIYREQIKDWRCSFCNANLRGEPIQAWRQPHSGGWMVKGYAKPLWLFIVCPNCDYQWALWKLGVPR